MGNVGKTATMFYNPKTYGIGSSGGDSLGGNAAQPPSFMTPPPPQITQAPFPQANAGPTIQQNADDLYKAQLKYNPELTAQAAQLQQQYGPPLAQSQTNIQTGQAPQLAQSQLDIQRQFGPQYRQLYQDLFPAQVAGQERLAESALQQLQSPYALTPEQRAAQMTTRTDAASRVPSTFQDALTQRALAQFQSPIGLTPDQQSAQDFVRNREQYRLQQGIRSQANLGGNLYSGNRQLQEQEGLAELGRQYSLQDIGLQQQQRQEALQQLQLAAGQEQGIASQRQAFGLQDIGQQQQQQAQALQNLVTSSQVIFPQVQQPGVAPQQVAQFGQGVTPSSDAVLTAMLQGQIVQPAQFYPGRQGTPGVGAGIAQGIGQGAGTFLTVKAITMCLPGTTLIDTAGGCIPIAKIDTGMILADGAVVMLKQEYAAAPTPFSMLRCSDGAWVETCDEHLIDGCPARTYQVGDILQGRRITVIHRSTRNIRTYDLISSRSDGSYDCQGIRVPTMIPRLHQQAAILQEVISCL